MNKQGGFTLVELMVVIVIVGILATVAIPAYNDSVRKGRRSDAKSTLTTVAARMEQYFMDNKTYTTNMTNLGFADDPAVSTDGFYEVDAAACAGGTIATCFVLTAAPPAGGVQEGDTGCTAIKIDSNGSQTPDSCW